MYLSFANLVRRNTMIPNCLNRVDLHCTVFSKRCFSVLSIYHVLIMRSDGSVSFVHILVGPTSDMGTGCVDSHDDEYVAFSPVTQVS